MVNRPINPLQPLARRLLLRIGAVIAVIVVLFSLLSYQRDIARMQEQTLAGLQETISARAQYESEAFVQAQNNTHVLRAEYLHRLDSTKNVDPQVEFDHWFVRYPDGLIRVRPELDDNKRLPSIYIRPSIVMTADLRRQVWVAFDLLKEWGPVLTTKYYSAYIDLPGISLIMFSPSVNWGKEADATTNNFDYPPVANSGPEHNPSRATTWTEVYFDDKAKIWMLSVITPTDFNGKWIATVSQDISIEELTARTLNSRMAGTYNIIIDESGHLLAHPVLTEKIQQSAGSLKISELDASLQQIAKIAYQVGMRPEVKETPDGSSYLAISRIRGPNWYLITIYPKALLEVKAFSAARNIFVVGIIALLGVLGILFWTIRNQVALPLERLRHVATEIEQGNLAAPLDAVTHRSDELGALAQSFKQMALSLQERDLAVRRNAHALEISEEQHRTLIANVPGIVFQRDIEKNFGMTFISAAVEWIAGYQGGDLLRDEGASFDQHIDSRHESALHRAWEVAAAEKTSYVVEYQFQRNDGQWRWFQEHGSAGGDANESHLIEGVILDVTALKAAEAALQLLNTSLEEEVRLRTFELERAVADLQEFNFVVSHDLRSPLRHLSGFLEIVSDEIAATDKEEAKQLVQRCQLSVTRMNSMISDLLRLAQVGSGGLNTVVFDLGAMTSELMAELSAVAPHCQMTVGSIPLVCGDTALLRQVMQNLLDNALKYSAKKSAPKIQVSGEIDVHDSGFVVISVTDNGAGFDPAYSDRLFKLFQRLHRQDEFAGTGVGLSFCAKIVGLHGGSISAKGELEVGCTMRIRLPRADFVGVPLHN